MRVIQDLDQTVVVHHTTYTNESFFGDFLTFILFLSFLEVYGELHHERRGYILQLFRAVGSVPWSLAIEEVVHVHLIFRFLHCCCGRLPCSRLVFDDLAVEEITISHNSHQRTSRT